MNSVIDRAHDVFLRLDAFALERPNAFPANSLGAETIAEIREIAATLTGAITAQTTGLSDAQRATAERLAAREALRETLKAIARTARVLALDMPGLENKFRLPRSGGVNALLHAARAFATDAAKLKAEFIRHEHPETFIEDLQAEIAALERAMSSQNMKRDAHITATASVDSLIEHGMHAVRKLDAIVRNKFRDDPSTLAAWESARHVERATQTRKRTNGGGGGGTNTPDDKKD